MKEHETEGEKVTATVQLICLCEEKKKGKNSPFLPPVGVRRGLDGMPHRRFPTAKQSSSRDSSLGPEKGGIQDDEPGACGKDQSRGRAAAKRIALPRNTRMGLKVATLNTDADCLVSFLCCSPLAPRISPRGSLLLWGTVQAVTQDVQQTASERREYTRLCDCMEVMSELKSSTKARCCNLFGFFIHLISNHVFQKSFHGQKSACRK